MQKVKFDVKNVKHLEEYKYFVINNSWKNGCPFELDWPFLTIPDMIKDIVVRHFLKIESTK